MVEVEEGQQRRWGGGRSGWKLGIDGARPTEKVEVEEGQQRRWRWRKVSREGGVEENQDGS